MPFLLIFLVALDDVAAEPPPVTITRASRDIKVDGHLDEAEWAEATRLETWFEINPGDNIPPSVRNVGYLTYDDRFFYAAFEFDDPTPTNIRAPLGDRDNVPSSTDYGGLILDTRGDGKSALMLLANPRGIQYDATSDDVTGNEDSSLDVFWDAAARITDRGWTLELRVPFSSLRYADPNPAAWRVLLYRNWPRQYRYQMFSNKLPRDVNCFICNAVPLVGLRDLPTGAHYVLAPFTTARRVDLAVDGPGSDLLYGDIDGDIGLDVKAILGASTALDATVNPDFSQIESDVAQIGSNERFALFFPERRPFFLEGLELLSTPIQAVYTRSITEPRWGARATGKKGRHAFTVLVAEDDGGGSTIIPGPNSSRVADQDFSSTVAIGRLRRDLGSSFVSVLAAGRKIEDGGHNVVIGPDFQWRPTERDKITGQLLMSSSRTPDRSDLAGEWDGRDLDGHALDLWWSHSTSTWDWFAELIDRGDGFRADTGFVPQVGIREAFVELGRTFRPSGFLRRVRTFAYADQTEDREGGLVYRILTAGTGADGRWNSFYQARYSAERIRSGDQILSQRQLRLVAQVSPSRVFQSFSTELTLGEQIDFANDRPGNGGRFSYSARVRPGDKLELSYDGERRWLDVDDDALGSGRLFTAGVNRLRATWSFNSRSYLRAIAQHVSTERDPTLYLGTPSRRSERFDTSLLFAYKLNWQTVLFLGYGDARERGDIVGLEPVARQAFFKLSYAFQR